MGKITILDAADRIKAAVQAVIGNYNRDAFPPDKIDGLTVSAYPVSGESSFRPVGDGSLRIEFTDTIRVFVALPAKSSSADFPKVVPYRRLIPIALAKEMKNFGFPFGKVTHDLGEIDWGTKMFGIIFDIGPVVVKEDVKI